MKKLIAIILIVCFLGTFAVLLAAPIPFSSVRDLTKRTLTAGEYRIDKPNQWLLGDKPIVIDGNVIIDFRGATVVNRQAVSTITGKKLYPQSIDIKGGTVTIRNLTGLNDHQRRIGIRQLNGDATLTNVSFSKGYGYHLERGHLRWFGGKGACEKYVAFLGNISAKNFATFQIEGVQFGSYEKTFEAPVRLWGASGKFKDCSFDAGNERVSKDPESIQLRHGNGDLPTTLINCAVKNSAVIGSLDDQGGEDWFAKPHPINVEYLGGSISGYLRVVGGASVSVVNVPFVRKDVRGHGSDTAVTAASVRGMTPRASLKDCTKGAEWRFLAGPNIKVEP